MLCSSCSSLSQLDHGAGSDHEQLEASDAKLQHQHETTTPSAVNIPVSTSVTAVTVHPDTEEIVAGTEAGTLLLLSA